MANSTRHCKALDYYKMHRLRVLYPGRWFQEIRMSPMGSASAIRTDLQMLHVLNANISRQHRMQVLARILRKHPACLAPKSVADEHRRSQACNVQQ